MAMNVSSILRGIAVTVLLCGGLSVLAQDAKQKTFANAEDAVVALVEATQANNTAELLGIFGADGRKVVSSGDPVMDRRNREVFLVAYAERAALMTVSPTRRVLYVGYEDWPLPIPLVQEGGAWRFDTAAGAQEILVRRIGRNELNAIDVCQVYVEAQREYAAEAHDGKPVGVYAQRIASTPGKHDGLYWRSEDPDALSPLGEFAAEAAGDGYRHTEGEPTPFHGYLFRSLGGQGKFAAGGGRSYLVNGEMRDGFALIAYPASYGVSGVMSFIVNQDGAVYQRDLGPQTAKSAAAISLFNPDSNWQRNE
jgi:hypothetical protein